MLNLSDYDYFLPPSLITNKPAIPRDFSRLFVYDTKSNEIFSDRFLNLDKYLPEKSFLVLNNTKVIPARVTLYKSSQGLPLQGGGKVKTLFLVNELKSYGLGGNTVRAMVDRKVKVGDRLYFDSFRYIDISKQERSIFTFKFSFSYAELLRLLEKKGSMPIPLYIKNTPLKEHELRKKYQTVFARLTNRGGLYKGGSAAAPTASLHFTKRLFSKLKKRGIEKYFIALHVGLGTFAPVTEKNIKEKRLHEEFYELKEDMFHCINTMKQEGYKLVAAGTTVARTLESLKFPITNNQYPISNKTDLFIFPPYNFKMIDSLITNFHLPKSSLMILVEAFLQFKKSKRSLIDLYKIAIEKNFRFYSFGDGMLIR